MGVPGANDFVERHVISTWGACSWVLWWVPRGPERGVSDPTGIGIPLRSFSFPSQFVLSSGELGIGVSCCAAQADRDLSETPPRHGRWSTTGGTSAGAWAKQRGGVPLGTGAVDALRWTPTVRVISPCAKKSAHTPHAHTRRERAVHTHARQRTLRDTTRTLSHARV